MGWTKRIFNKLSKVTSSSSVTSFLISHEWVGGIPVTIISVSSLSASPSTSAIDQVSWVMPCLLRHWSRSDNSWLIDQSNYECNCTRRISTRTQRSSHSSWLSHHIHRYHQHHQHQQHQTTSIISSPADTIYQSTHKISTSMHLHLCSSSPASTLPF